MSNPAELITTTVLGRTFRCTRRTEAHLLYTIKRLAKEHPDAQLVLIQTCYNTGVDASAGTHDFDAVFDVQIVGLDWWDAQAFLRKCGWAAWVRYPPTFGWHIHMVSLGYVGQVGIYVPGQVSDYYAHRSGLAGHVADDSWHPADISATIFDFALWEQELEDAMSPEDRTFVSDGFKALSEKLDAHIAREEAVRVKTLGRDRVLLTKLRKLGVNDKEILDLLESDEVKK